MERLRQKKRQIRRARSVVRTIDRSTQFEPPSPDLVEYCTDHRTAPVGRGIFGVPLPQSILYANVAISLSNDQGESFIYGYVPIVVAKCGVFLKEKGMLLLILTALFHMLTRDSHGR